MSNILKRLSLKRVLISASFAFCALTTHSSFAHAPGKPFGLGVYLGDPSGLSARYWIDQKTAADFALAYALDDYLILVGDYKYHFEELIQSPHHLHPYAGLGLGVGVGGDDVVVALRIPVGIEWMVGESPFGIFFELVPTVGIAPSTFSTIDGGLGVRYFF